MRTPAKIALAALLALAGFAWGVVCVRTEAFPYSWIQDWLPGVPLEVESGVAAPAVPGAPAGSASKQRTSQDHPDLPAPARTISGMYHQAPDRPETGAAGDEPSDQAVAAADTPYRSFVRQAPQAKHVTRYDPARAQDGINLVLSAHRPEATLRDMKGTVLHTWTHDYLDVWPEPLRFYEWAPHKSSWRRVHVYPDGSLLAIFEGIGMIKLDVDSNLVWKHQGRCHHDIVVVEDGSIYTLSRRQVRFPGFTGPVLEDFVQVLSPDGEELRRVSIFDAFRTSPYYQMLRKVPNMSDIFHTNTLEVLDGSLAHRNPAFARGNVLVSVRNINTIAVIDLEQERVVWALADMWRMQHQPTVLDNGNLLIFDNLFGKSSSRVFEFDPFTQAIAWSYEGRPDRPFDSPHSGSCQRLANGNTLITESVSGRAFEVTPEKEIVWEFINPHRAGDRDELIAVLFEVVRLNWDALDFPAIRQARRQRTAPTETPGLDKLIEKGR